MTIKDILTYKLNKVIVDKGTEELPTVTEEDKDFILAQAQAKIQTYCHRLDIPEQAYYVWADMAIDILRLQEPSLFLPIDTEDTINQKVKSISIGDTSVSLGDRDLSGVSRSGDSGSGSYDEILKSYTGQLQTFRKIARGCGDGLNGV